MGIEWKPEYSVRVEEIDDQHKKFVSLIDRLYNAICSYKTSEELKSILNGLVEYSEVHFSTEEKYFDKFKYKNSNEHKKEHKLFRKKLSDIIKKVNNNESEISFELIEFLENWLIDHVVEQDQKYVKCFTENGLS